MANHSNGGQTVNDSIRQKEQENLLFHDFLGTKTPAVTFKTTTEPWVSPEKTAASSGGGRGGLSSTLDLGSERQSGDGIRLFGSRSEISGSSMNNRLTGSKRSSSDTLFTNHEALEAVHLAKMVRHGPKSPSMAANPLGSFPPRGGHISHLLHQLSSSRFKDDSVAGPSLISKTAADEGSRTGMKGPAGILSSLNLEINSSGPLPIKNKFENFARLSSDNGKDLTSCTRQMTIFYGGQAHVFDDVNPNKADVIMALAGSNGGSWSASFSPKQKGKNTGGDEPNKRGQACEGGNSKDSTFSTPELCGRFAPSNRTFTPPGGVHRGSTIGMRGRESTDSFHVTDHGKVKD